MIRGNAILTSHIKLPMTFIIVLLGFSSVSACTALCLGDSSRAYIAKNYDWNIESGIIVINKRNVAKSALAEPNPARWISRYGSVTFNQYGREQPSGGINEAGLVVEVLWLQETDYPPPGDRGVVSELQWIQYQLDNYSKVDEVIASDSLISINGGNKARVHYFVGDAGGECAIVEFIDGERVAHTGESCPIRVITNNTYDESIRYATGFSRFGGKLPVRARNPETEMYSRSSSLDRFLHAAIGSADFISGSTDDDIDYAFKTLNSVRSAGMTVWHIVYDLTAKTVYFKSKKSDGLKYLNLGSCDFDCETPVKILDINFPDSGAVNDKFIEYSNQINYRYIKQAFEETYFLRDVSERSLRAIADYPFSTSCRKH